MTASERRNAILEDLCVRRFERINNLAFQYDKISRKVLSDINKKYGFTNRFCKDKIPYDRFFTIYNAFISAFDLQNYTYRQIDKFLWGKGKDLEEAKRENN